MASNDVSSPQLILASTSSYRRQLLDRLGLPYTVVAPGVDEARRPDENPAALSERLADAKACAVGRAHPQAWVIGSDQVAACDGAIFGKPGNVERATDQLRAASARTVDFHTSLCLRHAATNATRIHSDHTRVRFRALDEATIERYLLAEQPWDCAGSFKSEGLGIALFESIASEDPTALIGLPLIALARMLRQVGFVVP